MTTPESSAAATAALPKVSDLDQVESLDTVYRWPDAFVGSARSRIRHHAAAGATDQHRAHYFSFTAAQPDPVAASPAESTPDTSGSPAESVPERQVIPAGRIPGRQAPVFTEDRHPLAYTGQALDAVQAAMDTRARLRVVAADERAEFAALTTGTLGTRRAWGANVLSGPRLLSQVAGIPRQPIEAVLAQFPQLTLPTAQPVTAEGASLVEYASSAAGSVTLGRFGRWTDLTAESLLGADAAAVVAMHQVGIALDLDKVLIDATELAAGAAVGFTADVPAAIRTAIARVLANTAEENPGNAVILVNPDNVALLQDVTPTGGATVGERFQRFSGALVYPSTAVDTGFVTVANLRAGARYFEALALSTATDTDIKTGVETSATFLVGGYGVTLTSGFAVKVDVVTP